MVRRELGPFEQYRILPAYEAAKYLKGVVVVQWDRERSTMRNKARKVVCT